MARAALDDALRHSQERESFGRPIWKHRSVGNHLAGMAKAFASETAMEFALDAVRVRGDYGHSLSSTSSDTSETLH